MATTLKAHSIWRNVAETVASIDPIAIATQHLQNCHDEIQGYWDDADEFHEMIRFSQTPIPELISSSLGVQSSHDRDIPWLNLRYALKSGGNENAIGELTLILNDNLEIIDENWLLNLNSPHVMILE